MEEFSAQDLAEYRDAAEQRFWKQAVSSRIVDVQTTLDDLRVSAEVATISQQRREGFLNQIAQLASAAQASLTGAVEEAIQRGASGPEVDADSIQNAVDPVLEEWWLRQQAGLARIRQEAIQGLEQQREGQGWARFEAVYRRFAQPENASTEKTPAFVPKIEALSKKVTAALRGMDRVLKSDQAVKNPKKSVDLLDETRRRSVSRLGLAADIADAALPVALEIASMIEDKVQADRDRAQQREHREQVRAAVSKVVDAVADEAMRSLEPDIDALRQDITAQTVDEEEVARLETALSEAKGLLARGKKLIAQ